MKDISSINQGSIISGSEESRKDSYGENPLGSEDNVEEAYSLEDEGQDIVMMEEELDAVLMAEEPEGSYSRRASYHDYRDPGFYMLTFNINKGIMRLSEIVGTVKEPLVKNTILGNIVNEQIQAIKRHTPEIRCIKYVIMPDHIHILLQVTARLDVHLMHKIGGFMASCTKYYKRGFNIEEDISVFQKPHDRIVSKKGQINKLKKYIEDNPRRYLIKRQYPDLFRRHLHLEIEGQEYASMGNLFLLKQYYLLPVIVHRRWNEQQKKEYKEECLEAVAKGATLISGFINSHEKEIRNEALKMGGNIVIIVTHRIEEREKPQGRLFDLCAEGRLLLLGPWQDKGDRREVRDYESFHRMNAMAEAIAALDEKARQRIIGGLH